MTKRKRTEGQIKIYKALHKKLMISKDARHMLQKGKLFFMQIKVTHRLISNCVDGQLLIQKRLVSCSLLYSVVCLFSFYFVDTHMISGSMLLSPSWNLPHIFTLIAIRDIQRLDNYLYTYEAMLYKTTYYYFILSLTSKLFQSYIQPIQIERHALVFSGHILPPPSWNLSQILIFIVIRDTSIRRLGNYQNTYEVMLDKTISFYFILSLTSK